MVQGSRLVQSQALQQTQTLSPQQMLVVKLLELPTVEMEDRVRAELLENPALEEGREEPTDATIDDDHDEMVQDEGDTSYDSLSDYRTEDDIPDYRLREHNQSRDDKAEEIPFSDATSFYETLKQQLSDEQLDEHRRQLADYLIGSLDDDGLLRKSLDAIADELAIYAGIETTTAELGEVLAVVQGFDPPGLGARDLRECLLLQIDRKAETLNPMPTALTMAKDILTTCYEDFTRKNWDKIAQTLGTDTEAVDAAVREIRRLNPRPGASMGEAIGRNMQQIVPDFFVEVSDEGHISLSLNDKGVPEMRISSSFKAMLDSQASKPEQLNRQQREAMLFLKHKVEAARGFIEAVRRRREVLTITMQAIIDLQRDFFIEGDETRLRPMTLKDVAGSTGLSMSTVSRVSNSKYVHTRFGTLPLKWFFGDGYTTGDGEALSVRQICAALQELVDAEDKKCPLTDDQLADLMAEKGFVLARRTIAKYRQQLHIPVARLRR